MEFCASLVLSPDSNFDFVLHVCWCSHTNGKHHVTKSFLSQCLHGWRQYFMEQDRMIWPLTVLCEHWLAMQQWMQITKPTHPKHCLAWMHHNSDTSSNPNYPNSPQMPGVFGTTSVGFGGLFGVFFCNMPPATLIDSPPADSPVIPRFVPYLFSHEEND